MGAKVDIDALNQLAAKHVESRAGWLLAGDVKVSCEVDRERERWTVEARFRSAGGGSRRIWFHDGTMRDVVALAGLVFKQPFRGWRIYE